MTVQRTKVTTKPWDPAEHIRDDEDAAVYLDVALIEGDYQDVAWALGVVSRAKGMAAVAEAAGLGRESLYKALSPNGNPEFATVLKVVQALGLRLRAEVDAGQLRRQGLGTEVLGSVRGTAMATHKTKTRPWDPARTIRSDVEAADYLDAALELGFEDGDFRVVAAVIGDIVRWKGMAAVASDAGLDIESLSQVFSDDGNPDFTTVLNVVRALGFRLHASTDAGGSTDKV